MAIIIVCILSDEYCKLYFIFNIVPNISVHLNPTMGRTQTNRHVEQKQEIFPSSPANSFEGREPEVVSGAWKASGAVRGHVTVH